MVGNARVSSSPMGGFWGDLWSGATSLFSEWQEGKMTKEQKETYEKALAAQQASAAQTTQIFKYAALAVAAVVAVKMISDKK